MLIKESEHLCIGFPGSSHGKESAYNAGDLGSVPGLGRYLFLEKLLRRLS